ncbi:His Kinase A (phospho-acceptor) domain-containing protein [Mariniphaga anaerophila]|uniref:histidine kinase n=1 Tax=Mariniphaga anaerophila TaxID=1484053 RepID=A0A1M5F3Z9_9BACT|nr:response regulator [Mariniphaga anaerophila]SHF86108.1 His Kinase A (phospho-acceptor) domain-containing protein [Mariniphaga anaerophila]
MKSLAIEKAKVLIVDDQQDNIDVLSGLLEMKGYFNIKTTTDSRLTIELCKTFCPDIILLDLMMPYFDGFQIMEQLKECIAPDDFLPILVLTADVSQEARQKALNSGAKDFVTKPFDFLEVDLRIRNLLETRFLYLLKKNQNKILEEEVKKRTLELEKANNELKQLDEAKSDFLNLISHEINTPLNGILGFISILKSELKASRLVEMLKYLEVSARRLERFAWVSLNITRLKTQNLVIYRDKTIGNHFVNHVKNKYAEQFHEKEVSLKCIDGSCESRIYGDVVLTEFCFDSIVKNAIQYSPKGGEITIEIKNDDRTAQCIFSD